MKIIFLFVFIALHSTIAFAKGNSDNVFPEDSVPQRMPIIDYKFNPKGLILPTSLIGVGLLGHAVDGMQDYKLFKRGEEPNFIKIDDYMEWGLLGWVFVCDLMGKENHKWTDQLFIIALAEGMNAIMVQGLKHNVGWIRPDGRPNSFPSGHTANSFLGAHVAYKEFKDSSPALAYSGYAVATFVAASRLLRNRHWVADVIAGAGFGILSVELSYLIYFPLRNAIARSVNKKAINPLVIAPVMSGRSGGLYISYTF